MTAPEELTIRVAGPQDASRAADASALIEVASRTNDIARRDEAMLRDKIETGRAVVAYDGDELVGFGYFADWGTAQGLIWDALEAVSNTPSEDFVKRIFEFVCRCAEVDDYELHNPARIGFLCKVAHTEGGSMTPDELGHRLSSRLIDANKELFSFHYGLDGFNRMKAANSGQRRQ